MTKVNAIHVAKLAKYNFDYISLEEVILLEYLMLSQQKNNLESVKQKQIELETGLKRSKINSATGELEMKGFIETRIEKRKVKYTLCMETVLANYRKISNKNSKRMLQYYYFIMNPNYFNTKATKAKFVPKSKRKEINALQNQTSLF
jgi:DNA-binding MarR family transcriptional regulator